MIFDLAGGVRSIAELVLQPHDVDRIARAVRCDPRHQEAGQTRIGVGERQEAVAHRRRAEPFVPDQPKGALTGIRHRIGARRVGAHVAAALFLGHRHAQRDALFLRDRAQRCVIGAADERIDPRLRPLGFAAQRGYRRIGHVDRAHRPRLGLREHRQHRGMRNMPARSPGPPRDVVDAVIHRERHQRMIRRMKPGLVQPPTETVERHEFRRMAIGERAEFQHMLAADRGTEFGQRRRQPCAALAVDRLGHCRIGGEQVAPREFTRLIGHVVRLQKGRGCESDHDALPAAFAAMPLHCI